MGAPQSGGHVSYLELEYPQCGCQNSKSKRYDTDPGVENPEMCSLGEGYLNGYRKKGYEKENCTSYAERLMDLQPPGLFLHKTGDDGPSQHYAQCKDHKARVAPKQKNHTTSLYDMVLMWPLSVWLLLNEYKAIKISLFLVVLYNIDWKTLFPRCFKNIDAASFH